MNFRQSNQEAKPEKIIRNNLFTGLARSGDARALAD